MVDSSSLKGETYASRSALASSALVMVERPRMPRALASL
jgi:hypothetical protein